MRDFDGELISIINTFENLSKTQVRDCLKNDCLYFLVETGKAGLAIGKGGQTIKSAERTFQKKIKIFEWDADETKFISNLVPLATKVEIKDGIASVSLDNKNRGIVIGKLGSNIKALNELIQRNSSIKELKIL